MGKKKNIIKGETAKEKEKGAPTINNNKLIIIGAVLLIGLLHSQHLSLLFENDRYFSALSPLERDLSLRTEMGLYYSYYKVIINSDSVINGINNLINDNITEYPDTINTLKRFNLYPEVIIGLMYRGLRVTADTLKLNFENCFKIERGRGMSSIITCTGLTVPHYFYMYCVFALNSLLPISIFLLSHYLSNSLFGGLLSVAMFFYNHSEATRVMWTPPLRESFSMPFLFLQFLFLTKIINNIQGSVKNINYLFFGISTLFFMIPWQFSQFTILTQVLSIMCVYSLGLIPKSKVIRILLTLMIVLLINYIVQFGNVMLLTSYLMLTLLSSLTIALCHEAFHCFRYTLLISFLRMSLVVVLVLVAKVTSGYLLGIKDDAHIGSILLSKFTSYQDFHTQLYTCAAEFDFISFKYFMKLSVTILLPLTIVIMLKIMGQFLNVATTDNNTQAVRLYHILQLSCFAVMSFLIMRLKLFLTPHLCIISGLLASRKLFKLSSRQRAWVLGGALALSSIAGLYNLNEQMSIIGEYSNPELEEMINWINDSLPKNGVFGGSLPLMASIKLTTDRPIVVHPHYEHTDLRERALLVYTIYSKRSPEVIYNNLRGLGVEYVVMETPMCHAEYRKGCALSDVYLNYFPDDINNDLFCDSVQESVPSPFKLVYSNEVYRILMVGNHTQ
ncbi:PREDICTED: probable C-mannosyltransferase DPY19L1 [Amphimedon queenslandica]|uniref:C-mannosyltransferase DPY19L1 n=1 Tax=Amphimedon queenslandica TaxID=400682 RepID=A0A1X7V7M3_AMPQE|nr:PREDICTED: probable C-mannosyltransferase DPY19L1 [Amphimedon queenslandica]|eukprot:XP_019850225.1 PREDICTED: probable C-mannosyltransferase DPY19L1 [Amphimedon queenslandica]